MRQWVSSVPSLRDPHARASSSLLHLQRYSSKIKNKLYNCLFLLVQVWTKIVSLMPAPVSRSVKSRLPWKAVWKDLSLPYRVRVGFRRLSPKRVRRGVVSVPASSFRPDLVLDSSTFSVSPSSVDVRGESGGRFCSDRTESGGSNSLCIISSRKRSGNKADSIGR